jgi:hypothetical protein
MGVSTETLNDILRAVNGEGLRPSGSRASPDDGTVSPTVRLGSGGPTATGARFYRAGVLRFALSA